MVEKETNTAVCPDADFTELAPVLEKYATVPGSRSTVTFRRRRSCTFQDGQASCRPRFTELQLFMRSSV